MTSDPLILTLAFDPQAFHWFDTLRRAHFPAERNFIPAHLTLFHHLPGDALARVERHVAEVCASRAPFDLAVAGLRHLGRGVAFRLESADLAALRADLATRFDPWLTPQDRARHAPHVTIQNKVTPQAARALLADLEATFTPVRVGAEGLLLWRYRGGPWDLVRRYPFAATAPGSRPERPVRSAGFPSEG